MKQDFPRLYSQLGVHPDCSLGEFKQAYRRRIAELHPDKATMPGGAGSPSVDVSELNSAYAAALSFHKRQGRLPGSKPHPPATPRTAITPQRVPAAADRGGAGSSRTGNLLVVLLLALILVLILLGFGSAPSITATDAAAAATHDIASAPSLPPPPSHLALGMDAATVIAVQGQPHHVRGDEWSYGPSWLRFENGHLVDWHSSPLHRLRIDSAPPADDRKVSP